MKKLISLFIVATFLVACDPPKWVNVHSTSWYTKNLTPKTIIIKSSYFKVERSVLPGDSAIIFHFMPYQYLGAPSFGILYENRSDVNIEDKDKQIDILSDGGEVLKTWTYLEKENPGKQFFHEDPWKLYSSVGGGGSGSIKCIWVFEISAEDISPKK